jgi:hypothetical protein
VDPAAGSRGARQPPGAMPGGAPAWAIAAGQARSNGLRPVIHLFALLYADESC